MEPGSVHEVDCSRMIREINRRDEAMKDRCRRGKCTPKAMEHWIHCERAALAKYEDCPDCDCSFAPGRGIHYEDCAIARWCDTHPGHAVRTMPVRRAGSFDVPPSRKEVYVGSRVPHPGEAQGFAVGAGWAKTAEPNPKDLIGEKKVPNLSVIPSAAIVHLARAMQNGAAKYGRMNWREHPVKASIYIDAAVRHLMAWTDGEEDAPDSDVHHLGHAMACFGILLDAQEAGNLIDDRVPGPAVDLLERFKE